MTSSNGNISSVTGHLCGEFTGKRWIPRTNASDAELCYLFDLPLNKMLSKQSWDWWFETPSCSLWRHCNDIAVFLWNVTIWRSTLFQALRYKNSLETSEQHASTSSFVLLQLHYIYEYNMEKETILYE